MTYLFSQMSTALSQEFAAADFISHDKDKAKADYLHHSSGQRIETDAVIIQALHAQYPHKCITTVSNLDLLEYGRAGNAEVATLHDAETVQFNDKPLSHKGYLAPARRLDSDQGRVYESLLFGKFAYNWKSHNLIVYVVSGSSGMYPTHFQYLIGGTDELANELIMEAGAWSQLLRNEIWVYDQGYWQKDAAMFQSVKKAKWEDVILDSDRKKAIQDEVVRFFNGQERYAKLNVPWKRGVIFHGPPGNGKTISIKALMNQLSTFDPIVPSLYVRSFTRLGGPQLAAKQVFTQARRLAPCILIFEDLDSIIDDKVRSYFLNELDGLQSNDGIYIVGSTNHLDRLDPGLSARPSRFDRKYEFGKPNRDERVLYCEYWRGKLESNDDVEFPRVLSYKIAAVTDEFSFATMQEAFVGALLQMASGDEADVVDGFQEVLISVGGGGGGEGGGGEGGGEGEDEDDGDWEDLPLWKQIKKQIDMLRKEL